jgi:hypothetical protein
MSTEYTTNPGSKSPEDVQREVRQSRAEVDETLEAIQDRLAPGQLFEQAVDYLRSSNGSDFLRNLGATVRDNPVPMALVGTGLAWLMLAGSRSRRRGYYPEGDYGEDYELNEDAGGRSWSESARESAREWSEGARETGWRAREKGGE